MMLINLIFLILLLFRNNFVTVIWNFRDSVECECALERQRVIINDSVTLVTYCKIYSHFEVHNKQMTFKYNFLRINNILQIYKQQNKLYSQHYTSLDDRYNLLAFYKALRGQFCGRVVPIETFYNLYHKVTITITFLIVELKSSN